MASTGATAWQAETEETVVRFSASQRFEHVLVMVSFTMLILTGLSQRFPEAAWAQGIIGALGGIYTTRFIHRAFAFVFIFMAAYHLASVFVHVFIKKRPMTMLPTLKDAQDAVGAMRYELGIAKDPPKFGRYDFRQKFEYWGMVLGATAMIVSGLILMYPVTATRILPGQFVPAAKAAHGYEAVMAFLVIIIWHLYGTHLGPEKFPFDKTIFTGRISLRRMKREHPLEYEEMLQAEELSRSGGRDDGDDVDTR